MDIERIIIQETYLAKHFCPHSSKCSYGFTNTIKYSLLAAGVLETCKKQHSNCGWSPKGKSSTTIAFPHSASRDITNILKHIKVIYYLIVFILHAIFHSKDLSITWWSFKSIQCILPVIGALLYIAYTQPTYSIFGCVTVNSLGPCNVAVRVQLKPTHKGRVEIIGCRVTIGWGLASVILSFSPDPV